MQDSAVLSDNYLQYLMFHMSDWTVPVDHNAVEELLRDPVIIRIITIVNLSGLSILELLEYDLSRQDISRAMAKGVIAFDKSTLPTNTSALDKNVLASGDYYFKFLSSKVKLTELGIFILETIEGNGQQSSPYPPSWEEEQLPVGPPGPVF